MANLLPTGGVIDRYIWDKDGNVISLGQFDINDSTITPIAPPEMPEGTMYESYLRYLKDDISPKTYPITTKRCIMGGISRGSTREIIDLSSFISEAYEGSINLINIGDHIKYLTVVIRKITGNFVDGENVLTRNLPIQYRPTYPLVLKGYLTNTITEAIDTVNKYTVYIALNGVLRLLTIPQYEVTYNGENQSVTTRPLIDSNSITAFALYVE